MNRPKEVAMALDQVGGFKWWRNDMERLTTKQTNGEYYIFDLKAIKETTCYDENGRNAFSLFEGEAIDRLGAYEDLEEQGLLLRLPCKIGQEVYVIAQEFNIKNNTSMHKIFTRYVVQIRGNKLNPIYFVTEGGDSFVPSGIGKRIFLTIEEAEAALEKLKGEEHE